MDQPTRYRVLLELAQHYGVDEDPKRGKGSERLWIRLLSDGSKRSIPVTCHSTGDVVGVGLIKAIRRRLLLTERDGVTDEEFYAKK